MPVKPQIRSIPRAAIPRARNRPSRLRRKGGSTTGSTTASSTITAQISQRTQPGRPAPGATAGRRKERAIAQASTMRPFCGKRPAGLNCRNTTIRANTSTLAIEVVAKKVTSSLRPAGMAGHTSSSDPEPIT